jgi:FtsP/CotA-like multicopper oxidase with cupredoxin domain
LKLDQILEEPLNISGLPIERATLTSAPDVPPPIIWDYPVLLQVPLTTTTKEIQLTSVYKYGQWTFNDIVPGPFIRARAGDVVEISLTNWDKSGNPHNIDCHAFIRAGGRAALTTAEENETKRARFRILYPGLYVYHCAAAPVPVHIANCMYGLMYVQPADGDLPTVDREYYVMQSEFYHEPPEALENRRRSSVVETITLPPGAATIVDLLMIVPGTYTLVDHALFRLDKGAAGYLNVSGKPSPDIYQGAEPPAPCVGCKMYP